jgi:hypothetical protein
MNTGATSKVFESKPQSEKGPHKRYMLSQSLVPGFLPERGFVHINI